LLAFISKLVVVRGRLVERENSGGSGGKRHQEAIGFFGAAGVPEGERLFAGSVAGEIKAELNGEDVFRAEAGIDALTIHEAADREGLRRSAEETNRDLRDDEGAAQLASARTGTSGLAAAFFQRGDEIFAACHSGGGAGEHADE